MVVVPLLMMSVAVNHQAHSMGGLKGSALLKELMNMRRRKSVVMCNKEKRMIEIDLI